MASNSVMYDELLRELEENTSLLLTPQQSKFLEDFKKAIKNEIPVEDTEDTQENVKEIVETFKKLSDINMNLKRIIGRLKIGKNARHKFFETYPKWNEVRKDAIKKLRDIAQAIQSNKKNCNVSRLVGYCTSIVGGGIALASAISIPLTMGLSTPLLVSGASLTAAGCSVSVGTSVTEMVMLNTEINKAKEIIEEDKKYFHEMNSWLEYSAKLDEVLSEIMKIDVIKSIAESVKDLVERGTKIHSDHARYSFIINRMLTLLSPNMVQVVPIVVIAYGIWLLGNIFLLLLDTQNQLVFDCACLTMKSIVGIASLGDDLSDVVRITSLFTSNAALAKDIAKAVYRGVAATLGIGLDVIGITLTSIDIHKGSLSSEAKGIIKAADDLEEEAKILREIYDKIKLRMDLDLERSLENNVNKCLAESNIELSTDSEYSLEDESNECHSENDFYKLQTQKKNKKNKKNEKNKKPKKIPRFISFYHETKESNDCNKICP